MTDRPKYAANFLGSIAPAAILEVSRIVGTAVEGRDLGEVFAELAQVPSYLLEPETPEAVIAREAAERAELWEAQRRGAAREREDILRARGIPAKDLDRILANNLQATPALERVRRWLCSGERLLVLAGAPDAGKTTAASFAAAQEPSEADKRWCCDRPGTPLVVYLEVELLLQVWLHRDGREPLTGRSREDLVSCWLLVIDDLGQEAGTDALVKMVGEAVDHLTRLRSDRKRRTLITTNIVHHSVGQNSLVARYGARAQRMIERLTEFGAWSKCEALGLRRARGEEATGA